MSMLGDIRPVVIKTMTVTVSRSGETYVASLCLVNPKRKIWPRAECLEVHHGMLEKATESIVRMRDGKKLYERIWTVANLQGNPIVRIKETVHSKESGIREEVLKKMLGK